MGSLAGGGSGIGSAPVPGTSSLVGTRTATPTKKPVQSSAGLSISRPSVATVAAQAQSAPTVAPPTYATPPPISTFKVEPHPFQTEVFGAQMKNNADLGKNVDEMATLAMQRDRDLASGMMKEAANARGRSGFASDTGLSQRAQMDALARGRTGTNVDLANAGRDKLQAGLANASQTATGVAGTQTEMAGNLMNYQVGMTNANTNAQQAAQAKQNMLLQFVLDMYKGFM